MKCHVDDDDGLLKCYRLLVDRDQSLQLGPAKQGLLRFSKHPIKDLQCRFCMLVSVKTMARTNVQISELKQATAAITIRSLPNRLCQQCPCRIWAARKHCVNFSDLFVKFVISARTKIQCTSKRVSWCHFYCVSTVA